jgi:hypothetical protein
MERRGEIMFSKAIAVVFGFILTIIISIAVMIYGWGLEPKSWSWIVGGGVGLRFMVSLLEAIAKKEK